MSIASIGQVLTKSPCLRVHAPYYEIRRFALTPSGEEGTPSQDYEDQALSEIDSLQLMSHTCHNSGQK
jgi:hypothetical protein